MEIIGVIKLGQGVTKIILAEMQSAMYKVRVTAAWFPLKPSVAARTLLCVAALSVKSRCRRSPAHRLFLSLDMILNSFMTVAATQTPENDYGY